MLSAVHQTGFYLWHGTLTEVLLQLDRSPAVRLFGAFMAVASSHPHHTTFQHCKLVLSCNHKIEKDSR